MLVRTSVRTNTGSDRPVFMHEQFGSSITRFVVRATFCGETDNVSVSGSAPAFREHNEYLFTLISKSDYRGNKKNSRVYCFFFFF